MTWILGVAAVTAVIVVFRLSPWLQKDEEMGSVSGQWLAEYRQDRES